MKKRILLAFLLSASTIFGQIKTFSNLYTADFGMSIMRGTESDDVLYGYNFNFVYDHFTSNTTLSGGFTFGYMKANYEGANKEVAYTTMPILLQGKYFPTKGRSVYLQGGVGIHFSQAEYLGISRYLIASDSGIMMLAGVGSFIQVDKDLFINVAYSFNWLDSQTYQNGIIHSIKIGLAFN